MVKGGGIRVTGSGVRVTESGIMVGLGDREWYKGGLGGRVW